MARFLQRALQSEGYEVELAFDGEQALCMGLSGGLDLMVLDVMLPRRDGFDVIRNLRAAKQMLPTIMVTARDAMSDIVRGLDLGADDYLTKPFALDVLLARVRALTRRGPAAYPQGLQFEDLTLNSRTHELRRGERSVSLTRTEYALMETLIPRGMHRVAGRTGGSRLGRRCRSQRRHSLCVHPQPQSQDCAERRAAASAYGQGRRLYAAGRRSLKNTSLSLRLTAWFSAIFLTGFVLFGIVMWIDLAYSLSQGRDRTLMRRAARIEDILVAAQGESLAIREARFEQQTDAIPEGNLIQLFDQSGRRLLPLNPTPADFPWLASTAGESDEFTNVDYGGRVFRMLKHPTKSNPDWVILVAGQLDDNRNMMARFTTGLAWAIPAMLVLSSLGGYFLNRRALEPVDQITATLRSISIGNLSRRLPVANTGDELQRLAETCNEMLARLNDAVERINRFTADASHELRSPVALIRTVAEYALRNPKMDGESKEAFGEILAESMEAGQLLDMLTLARADAGYANAVFEPVELAELIEDVGTRVRPLAEIKRQMLCVCTDGSVWVNGDRSSLRRLVGILLDNAVKYTPAGGRIAVALATTGSKASLTVSDSGIGIPETLLPRIFDRFVRADPSRGEVNGTGLGLAIAKWIASAHDASLTVQSREREGSVFTVEFETASRA
jgi:signal transduction histidine kinase/DNA-binding NarL/FixJ family response regulator